MAERKGFASQHQADSALAEVEAEIRNYKRFQRRKQNQLLHESTYASLPKATQRKLRKALAKPDNNKKRIAREYGQSHAFIVWLWRQHEDL